MFMRTVKMHVRLDDMSPFTKTYEHSIIPAFGEIDGCLSAVLMQSTREPEECVSLTFWRSEADIRKFESSGRYDHLIGVLSPFFLESYELQIRLTEDLRLDYAPSNEPEVRRYKMDDPKGALSAGDLIIRMVSVKFRIEKVAEFREHYEKEVIPLLKSVEGCRGAFLAEPADSKDELISVTEWESEQAAQKYEHGGTFDALLESQRHFFATLVDMGLGHSKGSRGRTATSDDITVDKHKILVGRRFKA